ncbi:MAG: hypothetical protein ACT4PV_12110 [Planctomycetaceae bacterium]
MRWLVVAALLAACGEKHEEGGGDHDHDHDAHRADGRGHDHDAPHGGAIVVLGDEFAHIEILADAVAGRLTLYLLDGHAQKGVRSADEKIRCTIRPAGFVIELLPATRPTTGEKPGDASEFSTSDDRLKGLTRFTAVLERVVVKGKPFEDVEIPYPEGSH